MYTLRFDEDKSILEIKRAKKAMQNLNYTEEITYYNCHYYICLKRKPLIDKAKELKQQWMNEAMERVRLIESIDIK